LDFKQSEADPCVYVQKKLGNLVIIAVYVDDLIVIANTAREMKSVKGVMAAKFKMKDMGQLHYCLEISVKQSQDENHRCLWMDQRQYISNLLLKYCITEANTVPTPVDISASKSSFVPVYCRGVHCYRYLS